MKISEYIKTYKLASNYASCPNKDFVRGEFVEYFTYTIDVQGTKIAVARFNLRDYPQKCSYSLNIKSNSKNTGCSGLFAQAIYNMCQKKYNAGKQK